MSRFIISILFFSSSLFAQSINKLLPDSAANWKRYDSAAIYAGNELYKLIDGGADIFNEYGFNQVIVQRYKGLHENYIDIEIYEMKDSSSAFGIFSLFTLNTGEKIDIGIDAYAGDQFLLFRKGNYYLTLTALNLNDETKEGILLLAKETASKITPGEKPALALVFNESANSKIAYIKGRLGLYNISRINFGKEFKVEEGVYFEAGTVQNYVFSYKNKDDCRKNYLSSLESFKNNPEYKPQQSKLDINIFKNRGSYIEHICMENYIIFLISKNKTDLEKMTKEIKDIIKNKGAYYK